MTDPSQDILINREISWLHFNERVLQEAIDSSTPLIERIKFLGIFSNNRDEFFRVRVGTLRRMLNIPGNEFKINLDPVKILREIDKIVNEQEKIFTRIYSEIVRELAREDIYLIDENQLTEEQGRFVHSFFNQNVRPLLFPIMINNINISTSLVDSSLYLLVDMKREDDSLEENQALIRVPTDIVNRFVILPKEGKKEFIILLDDVCRYCLSDIFSFFGYDTFFAYTIKFTRDAELDIDNDISKSFLELLSESVKQRKKGLPVRFVYEDRLPQKLLKKLIKKLKISEKDNLRSGGRYHNFKDFMSFPRVGPSHLYYPLMPPLPHADLPLNSSIFEILRKQDVMLHFPYQSFQYIIDLLREASIDPRVVAIKMTFYRVAKHSIVMNALINAARNHKTVTVFMELQARFDEEANIYWTNRLQEEGIQVIQTIPGFKVHAKLILIKRLEEGKEIGYANISTGNYNESTARVYADDSLLTANQEITRDVDNVFKLMDSRFKPPEFKHLIVSPFDTRKEFIRLINNEIKNRKAGKEAWILIKLNSLVDNKLIDRLYAASQAGVSVKIIVRGICVLVPGLPGISENIEAFSIVDKFLEHSRIYIFCNENKPLYYIASSDWMQRNLDHRIEVACPIFDTRIQEELMNMIQIQLKDNCKARIISARQPNRYRKDTTRKKIRAQFEIYAYFERSVTDKDSNII
jgi:polyphosphate kinase